MEFENTERSAPSIAGRANHTHKTVGTKKPHDFRVRIPRRAFEDP